MNTSFNGNVNIELLENPDVTAAETIIAVSGTDGLVNVSDQVGYRYQGTNPNNYVRFNNEIWRIIGVEDGSKIGLSSGEPYLKIIRNDNFGNVVWNTESANDWTQSSVKRLLNEGDYFNRQGNYQTNGLTNNAKKMITNAKWYLGGWNTEDISTSQLYEYERGETVYNGRPTSWIGKIGLMYPSDYGYSASQDVCELVSLKQYNGECKNVDWLFNNTVQWTMTSYSIHSNYVFNISDNGRVNNDYGMAYYGYAIRPVAYLKPNVSISEGNGTIDNPYILVQK